MKHSIQRPEDTNMKDGQHNLTPNYIMYLGHELLNDSTINRTTIHGKT
jgi:hypothetical protein